MTSTRTYSVRERRLLIERISELGSTEHEEIFKIICDGGCADHSRNNNGVFVDATRLSDETIHSISEFVDFCITNRASLDEYDKRLIEIGGSGRVGGRRDRPPDQALSAPTAATTDADVESVRRVAAGAPPRSQQHSSSHSHSHSHQQHPALPQPISAGETERRTDQARYLVTKKRFSKRGGISAIVAAAADNSCGDLTSTGALWSAEEVELKKE